MAKSRKKVFPKKPERLNSKSELLLGKNSNKACREATMKGIYNNPIRVTNVPLTPEQERQLVNLRRNLSSIYQP